MRKTLITTVLLIAFGTAAMAQDKQNMFNPVTTSVTSLCIAPDARAGGLGDVGCATEADAESQYWNPAKYPWNIGRAGVSVSYTPWLRQLVNDINLANIAGFYRIGDYQAISASLRYFSLGEVMLTDGTGDWTSATDGMTINPYEMAIDVGYSRILGRTWSAAVAMRFIFSDITYDYSSESSPGKAFAADIAVFHNHYFMAGNRECQFNFGLNINNIGSKISYGGDDNSEFLPANLRLGLGVVIPFNEYNRLGIYGDANKLLVPTWPRDSIGNPVGYNSQEALDNYYDLSPISGIFKSFSDAPNGFKEELQEIQWSLGLEYNYNDRFLLRAGYHHEAANKGNRKYFTVGAGFKMSVFSIDAGYVVSTAQSNPLDQTMRFTLGFDLDGMKDLFSRKRR